MKTLLEYIEESLLDDIDDLERDSDVEISKSLSIGSEWEIASRYIGWTIMPILALVMYIIGLQ